MAKAIKEATKATAQEVVAPKVSAPKSYRVSIFAEKESGLELLETADHSADNIAGKVSGIISLPVDDIKAYLTTDKKDNPIGLYGNRIMRVVEVPE